jgi:hypothetical protein
VKKRRYHWAVLALAVALLGAALIAKKPWVSAPKAPRLSPLAIIPAGPAFVLHVDLARLRESKAGRELSELGWARYSPNANWAFEPLRDVDELVLAVPGDARFGREHGASFEPDAVALVATGNFPTKAITDAAFERIRARGGKPLLTKVGSFDSVRDLEGSGEVSARDGLLVLSDGAYLRALLAAAEGHRSDGTDLERTRDHVHAELRRSFGRGAPVTATLTLPSGWLESAFGDSVAARSPLALVRSAAVRVTVGERVELEGLLLCANADDCSHVAKFLVNARGDLETALGSDAALRHFRDVGKQDGERVEIALSLGLDEVAKFLSPPPERPATSGPTPAPSASAGPAPSN